jgi:hypothetical protein
MRTIFLVLVAPLHRPVIAQPHNVISSADAPVQMSNSACLRSINAILPSLDSLGLMFF